jgi:Zn-dependent M28 family amino/carboxypeptidase
MKPGIARRPVKRPAFAFPKEFFMRRIVTTSCSLAVLTGCVLLSVMTAAEPKAKSPKTSGKDAEPIHYGNADAITEGEAKIYDYFLASDQMEGRNLATRGYDAAALYVASHLAEWGLKPGGSTSGTDGPLQPYFIPLELVSRTVVPEESKAVLTSPAAAGGGRGGRGGGGGGRGAAAASGAGSGAAPAAPAGPQTTTFEYTKDWTTNAGGRGGVPLEPVQINGKPAVEISGSLAFVGNGYTVTKGNVNPYEGLDVKGKIVVIAGVPPEIAAQQAAGGRGGRGGAAGASGAAGAAAAAATPAPADAAAATPAAGAGGGRGGGGAALPSPFGENCTDYMTPEEAAAKNGAVAVIVVPSFTQLNTMATGGGGRGAANALNGPTFTVPRIQTPPLCPAVPTITAGTALVTAIFQGEKRDASQIFYAGGTNTKQDSFELNAAKKLDLHIALHTEPGHGENVMGILEGSDPVLKNEYVVISAHLDHLGFSAPLPDGHNIYNGADDDGSGSSGLLAVAHAFADGAAKGMRPRRSIVFLWNAGEEKGLWGSQYFNQFPSIDLTKVVTDLNMDMIGRSKTPGYSDPDPTHYLVNPGEVFLVGPNISSDDLEKTIETVNNSYQKLTLNHFYDVTAPDATHDNLGPQPRGQRIFYRSDHYNFAKMGIPIAFFSDGLHVDYHRPTDTPDKIDYKLIQTVSKTVAAVAWVLGTQDGRPTINAHLPDQLIKDMKTVKDQGWGKVSPVLPPLPHEPF